MGKYFGTDGFRGQAGADLTADHAYRIGRFLGWYYNQKRRDENKQGKARIVIGKDTRLSSYMFEYVLAGGIVSSGADAYLLHVTTTPCVAFVTRTEEFDCGIMISASHNPYYDNGIKLINCKGEKMEDEIIDKVEEYIDSAEDVPFSTMDEIGKSVDYVSGRNRYLGYLISLGMYSLKGKRIGIDSANGSAWSMAKSVFEAIGATVYQIGAEPDGTNINSDIGSTHIDKLQQLVKEKQLDAGFAFDGDADRCICVDEKGEVVDGDAILYIYGKYMKEKGELKNNTVVATVMSNLGLFKAFDRLGINYAKTAVGDKYVNEYMTKHECIIGGEQSGHIIFSKYASTGDGILTAIKMTEVMLARKMSLSQLKKGLTVYPQVIINVCVRDKDSAVNNPAVQQMLKKTEMLIAENGRVLLRKSGTEPVLRVMVEYPDKEKCNSFAEELANVIRKTQ